MEPVIFLDMDGVTADFFTGVCGAFGLPDPDAALARLAPLDFWFESVLGEVPPAEFWRQVDRGREKFWAGLPAYPWARELYDGLRALAPVVFLSHPSEKPYCAAGKLRWLRTHFPDALDAQDYALTRHKPLLAAPGRLLIDDQDANVRAFTHDKKGRPTGGHGLVFPRRWNTRHLLEARAAEVVLAEARAWRDNLKEAA